MRVKTSALGLCALLLGAAGSVLLPPMATAGQLVYTPINPTFGGSPFNGTFLLDQATAQNPYHAPTQAFPGLTAAQSFAARIEDALLTQAAAQLANDILGTSALPSGTFTVNGTTISWQTVSGEVTITIFDASTGGTTTITVPAP